MHINTHISIASMLKILFSALGALLLWYLKEVVLLIFLAFIISAVANYVAIILSEKYQIPTTWGISFTFVIIITIIVTIVTLLIPAIIAEGYAFSNAVPLWVDRIQRNLLNAGLFIDVGIENIQDLAELFPFVGGNAVNLFQGVFEIFTFGFLTVMLGFYIAMDPQALDKVLSLFVPRSYKKEFQIFLDKSRFRLGNWALSQITVALTTGIFLYTILSMTQVRYATLLALLWALSEIVPFVGPLLASVPVLIFSFSVSSTFGLSILACLIIIQVLKFTLLVPIFIDKKARLNPFAVVFSLMIGGAIAGPFGVVIATPIISILTLLKDNLEKYVNVDLVHKVTNE